MRFKSLEKVNSFLTPLSVLNSIVGDTGTIAEFKDGKFMISARDSVNTSQIYLTYSADSLFENYEEANCKFGIMRLNDFMNMIYLAASTCASDKDTLDFIIDEKDNAGNGSIIKIDTKRMSCKWRAADLELIKPLKAEKQSEWKVKLALKEETQKTILNAMNSLSYSYLFIENNDKTGLTLRLSDEEDFSDRCVIKLEDKISDNFSAFFDKKNIKPILSMNKNEKILRIKFPKENKSNYFLFLSEACDDYTANFYISSMQKIVENKNTENVNQVNDGE